MAAAMQRSADDLANEFVQMDEVLVVQATAMLRGFKDRDLVDADVEAALILYSILLTSRRSSGPAMP